MPDNVLTLCTCINSSSANNPRTWVMSLCPVSLCPIIDEKIEPDSLICPKS